MTNLRTRIRELAEKQKSDSSWVKLGELLEKAKNVKAFNDWGFQNFTEYCNSEFPFGKTVASDMINGRKFIENHYPKRISVATEFIPGYNEIAVLRRAKKIIPALDFERLKDALFKDEITRTQLRREVVFLSPKKQKSSKSTGDPNKKIKELEAEIRRLRIELRSRNNHNGIDPIAAHKLWRKLQRKIHPDIGGDTELCQDLNNFFKPLMEL